MEIKVVLVGSLRDKLPNENRGKATLTLPEGSTVADVISHFQLATSTAAGIGGTQIDKAHVLQDGDEVQLFRQLGGG